jgi:hypothetical protein
MMGYSIGWAEDRTQNSTMNVYMNVRVYVYEYEKERNSFLPLIYTIIVTVYVQWTHCSTAQYSVVWCGMVWYGVV